MKRLIAITCILSTLTGVAQDKASKIDSIITASHKAGQFYGNVLIAENGTVIYQKSFGKANYETGAALDSESVFELASVTKQFTAMGIMLLKKQGKLSYDDSLRKFFPQLPYSNITVRHLLHHTSGLPDYMGLLMKKSAGKKIMTNKDLEDIFAVEKPAIVFVPGEKWEYSNTGYALLASIIEKVSGMSFADYLRKHIFEPLGMERTRVYRRRLEKTKIDNYAFGYGYSESKKTYILPDDDTAVRNMVYALDGIVGDGTVNSTTGDLLKWDRALYTEKLVSKEMLAEAFQPGTLNDGSKTKYGFGWILSDMKTFGKVVNHSGGWPGYNTFIERHPDSDKTIILLRNHDRPVQVLSKIRDILYDIKDEPKKEISLPMASLSQYAGEYELAPGFTISITVERDKIYGQATGQEKFELFAEKENLFFLKVVEAKIKFEKDEKGAVRSLILYQGGQEVPGSKIK
jgi:CubicO group peptidase (beta-lactamase class C family)